MRWRRKRAKKEESLSVQQQLTNEAISPRTEEPAQPVFRRLEVASSSRHAVQRQQGLFQAADAWGGETAAKHRMLSFSAGLGVGLSLGITLGLRRRLTLPKPNAKSGEASHARSLLSRGEPVSVSIDATTWVPVFDALLDTGNEAHTVLSTSLARRLNAQPIEHSKPFMMTGTNGWSSAYPRCRFRVRIAGHETDWIEGAVGGSTTLLIGRDVLLPLGEAGYTVRMI